MERWLTCLNHPKKPGGSCHTRRKRSSRDASSWWSTGMGSAMDISAQGLQVSEQRLQVLRVHWIRRHAIAGLDRLRIGDPSCQTANVVGQCAGSDGLAARQMGEVRPDAGTRIGTTNGVAHHASFTGEYLFTAGGERISRI